MNTSNPESSAPRHLGPRLAIALAGLLLIGLMAVLGLATMRQADTAQALENHDALSRPAPAAPSSPIRR